MRRSFCMLLTISRVEEERVVATLVHRALHCSIKSPPKGNKNVAFVGFLQFGGVSTILLASFN